MVPTAVSDHRLMGLRLTDAFLGDMLSDFYQIYIATST